MPNPAVSVVVPVYNPGADLERCINSLLAQSLPPERLELIFVDDGSTDSSPERLDRLAAEHSHVKVIHEPNSGWAGRPRNVGTDAASGEFVQYVDQDDELGRKALERLYEFGNTNEADIVIGKVTSDFRAVPHDLWRTNVGRCSIRTHPLITSLTPHKMFRTEFLRRTGIRFPEGRRRLEDQVFMVAAYFATDAVSILADYPCYFYMQRDDGENSGAQDVDPAGYYNNLREVLDIIAVNTQPGELRNDLMTRFANAIARRISNVSIDPDLAPGYAEALFEQARGVVLERFPETLRASLPTLRRERIDAIAKGDLTQLRDLAKEGTGIRATAEVIDIRSADKGWTFQIAAQVRDHAGNSTTVDADPRDRVETSVFVRERRKAIEWFVGDPLPGLGGDVALIPSRLAAGTPVGNGAWQLGVRVRALGLTRIARLKFDTGPELGTVRMRRGRAAATLEPAGVLRVRPTA